MEGNAEKRSRLLAGSASTSSTAPTEKVISSVAFKLKSGVSDKMYTIAVMGNADSSASQILGHSSFSPTPPDRTKRNKPDNLL